MPRTSPTPPTAPRMVRAALFLLIASLFGAATTGCESTDLERNQVISLVNETRMSQGLAPLKSNTKLSLKADAWAKRLRDACELSHSRLADGAPKSWLKLGENVGYGGDISVVHDAYLRSPGHYANIVDPAFTQMGAAAVWGDCDGQHRVFTVQVFMKA